MKPIKALLLSAGYGTRLRPLTLTTPKCLVQVNGIPVIEYWLSKLEFLGVNEVLINTHYLADKVVNYLKKRKKSNLKIVQIYESKLNGTAGTLMKNRQFFLDSNVLFIHADNFTQSDLSGFVNAYLSKPRDCLLTMLTFKTNEPKKCGVVKLDKNGLVEEFHEKVNNPPTKIANGAVYLFNDKLIDWMISDLPFSVDFSTDVIPSLIKRINTWEVDSDYLYIGTPEALNRANKLFL